MQAGDGQDVGGAASPEALEQVAIAQIPHHDTPASDALGLGEPAGVEGGKAGEQADELVELGGCWAVVMELVDGASLDDLVKGDGAPLKAALEIVAEIARSSMPIST